MSELYWADGTHKGELETILCGHTGDLLQKWQKKAIRKAMRQADRIAELERQLQETALQSLSDSGQFMEKISELIAMLRGAQKDAARWQHVMAAEKYAICKWNPFSESWTAFVQTSEIDAAMQRDCGGAQHAKEE